MISSLSRAIRLQQPKLLSKFVTAPISRPLPAPKLQSAITNAYRSTTRCFSTTTSADPDVFKAKPPSAITPEMAEGIQDTNLFYLQYGISNQRLVELSKDADLDLVTKWPRMMEIYLSTQVFVISGLGFSGDEAGLQYYTQLLSKYMSECDEETREYYRKGGQETWRTLLCTAFDMDPDDIKPIEIVEARNIMHKVSSRMQEPSILMKVQKECSKVQDTPEIELEVAQKHNILQSIILNDVYMGGERSIPEECGFGPGGQGYARLQCGMAQFEGDPLIAQYMAAATARMWEAAGLDTELLQGAGAGSIRG